MSVVSLIIQVRDQPLLIYLVYLDAFLLTLFTKFLTDLYNNLKSVKETKVGDMAQQAMNAALTVQNKEKDEIISALTSQLDFNITEMDRLKKELQKYKSPEKRITEGFVDVSEILLL